MVRNKQEVVKVSIILPVYNHARWVGQAIHSVLSQTLGDFELIIIDDASQDASREVIDSVCQSAQDSRVRTICHAENRGAPASINEGLQQARGKYFAILNSDDVWDAGRLERLVSVAEAGGIDFMAADIMLLDADSQPKEHRESHWVSWFESLKQDYAGHGDFWATLLRGNFLITTSNFFFHHRVFEQVGGFADWRYVHDYDYALRVLLAGFRVQFLAGEKLLGYRLHDTNTIREKPLAAIEENMRLLLDYLPQLGNVLNAQRLQGLQVQLQNLYRYTREEWLTAVHERLLQKEQELLPLIEDRDRWIDERDAVIAKLSGQLELQGGWIADRDRWIAERDSLLQQQRSGLQDRDNWIADRDRWIAERDRWIAERDELIRRLQRDQQALLNSRSFRLGSFLLSPMRWFRQRFNEVSHA